MDSRILLGQNSGMTLSIMKILAIDYGDQKIGIAIGDTDLKIALPRETVLRKDVIDYLAKIILDEGINKIIVGWPKSLSGKENKRTKITEKFIAELKNNFDLPIEIQDERLSTKIAQQKIQSGSKLDDDALAAMNILQGYLDKKKLLF